MSETDWIVQRDDSRYSAADIGTLQDWARTGKVLPSDEVWHPLRGEWSAATETPELAGLIVRPSAPLVIEEQCSAVAPSAGSLVRASIGLRGAGYLIDVIPAILMGLIAIIPLIGHVIAGVLLGFYWLYRDAARYSLGKMALQLNVVWANGDPATKQHLVRRNLPFAIAGFVFAIPIVGLFSARSHRASPF